MSSRGHSVTTARLSNRLSGRHRESSTARIKATLYKTSMQELLFPLIPPAPLSNIRFAFNKLKLLLMCHSTVPDRNTNGKTPFFSCITFFFLCPLSELSDAFVSSPLTTMSQLLACFLLKSWDLFHQVTHRLQRVCNRNAEVCQRELPDFLVAWQTFNLASHL